MAFLTGQPWHVLKSWYTGEGSEQGFQHCFIDGLNQGLVSSAVQATFLWKIVYKGTWGIGPQGRASTYKNYLSTLLGGTTLCYSWVNWSVAFMNILTLSCCFTNIRKVKCQIIMMPPVWPEVWSLYLSGQLPTYPSPKPTLTLTSHLGQNVGLGEG